MKIYVATLEGEVKDHYMAVGSTEEEAKTRIINKYYGDTNHDEASLNADEVYVEILVFDEKTTAIVY